MQLTATGQQLYACCHLLFAQLDQCLEQLQQQQAPVQAKSNLVLSCEATIAMKWLIPRLPQFNQRHPDIDITLLTAGGAVDFQQQSIDVALRRNDFPFAPHLYQEKIADEYMCCVAKSAQEIPFDQVFISSSRPSIWQDFIQSNSNPNLISSLKPKTLQHFYLCIEACLAELGGMIGSIYMLEKELQYQILHLHRPIYADQSAYYLLSALPFEQDQAKIFFKTWLIEQMQQSKIQAFRQ